MNKSQDKIGYEAAEKMIYSGNLSGEDLLRISNPLFRTPYGSQTIFRFVKEQFMQFDFTADELLQLWETMKATPAGEIVQEKLNSLIPQMEKNERMQLAYKIHFSSLLDSLVRLGEFTVPELMEIGTKTSCGKYVWGSIMECVGPTLKEYNLTSLLDLWKELNFFDAREKLAFYIDEKLTEYDADFILGIFKMASEEGGDGAHLLVWVLEKKLESIIDSISTEKLKEFLLAKKPSLIIDHFVVRSGKLSVADLLNLKTGNLALKSDIAYQLYLLAGEIPDKDVMSVGAYFDSIALWKAIIWNKDLGINDLVGICNLNSQKEVCDVVAEKIAPKLVGKEVLDIFSVCKAVNSNALWNEMMSELNPLFEASDADELASFGVRAENEVVWDKVFQHLKEILVGYPYENLMEFARRHNHNKLWDLIADVIQESQKTA